MFTSKRIIAGFIALAMLLTSTAVVTATEQKEQCDDFAAKVTAAEKAAVAGFSGDAEAARQAGKKAVKAYTDTVLSYAGDVGKAARANYCDWPTPSADGAADPEPVASSTTTTTVAPPTSTVPVAACPSRGLPVLQSTKCLTDNGTYSDDQLNAALDNLGYSKADRAAGEAATNFNTEAEEAARKLRDKHPGAPKTGKGGIVLKLENAGFSRPQANHGANVAFAP